MTTLAKIHFAEVSSPGGRVSSFSIGTALAFLTRPMKRKVSIIVLGSVLVLAPMVFGAQGEVQISGKVSSSGGPLSVRQSYALVVGNGNFLDGWVPLPGALKDAEEVAQALRRKGFSVNLETNLTKAGFLRALDEFVERYGKVKRYQLLFYYAGHGYTRSSKTGQESGYLVMTDTPHPKKDPASFQRAALDLEEVLLKAWLVEAEHVIFLFDSCASVTRQDLRDRLASATLLQQGQGMVRQFITAGRTNESVPDCSVFKQMFLNLLQGREPEPIPDGYLTGEELGICLRDRVPPHNPAQHPQYWRICTSQADRGDFVFVVDRVDKGLDRKGIEVSLGGVQRGFEIMKPAAQGEIKVCSEPTGGRLYLNGKDVGQTPLVLSGLRPGEYGIRVLKEGCRPYEVQVHITPGERKTVWAYLEVTKGVIAAKSEPAGAEVFLDGKPVGVTPFEAKGLSPKRYSVRMEKPGYEPWKGSAAVKAGESAEIVARLKKQSSDALGGLKGGVESFLGGFKKVVSFPVSTAQKGLTRLMGKTGTLVMTSVPPHADVYLDGKFVGSTPLTQQNIPVGGHEVRMVKQGYAPCVRDVVVKEGERLEVQARLEPPVLPTVSPAIKRSSKTVMGSEGN
jgi:hypothetical protein